MQDTTNTATRPDRPGATFALGAFLLIFFGLLGFGFLVAAVERTDGMLWSIVNIMVQVALFGIPVLWYYHRNDDLLPAMRMRMPSPLLVIMSVAAALVGLLALNWLSIYFRLFLEALGLQPLDSSSMVPRTLPALMTALVTSALTPAVFEEVYFRGFLMPSLEGQGRVRAVLISGVLFAALHGQIEALPVHLLLGFVLALLVLRTGSLPLAMIYHGVYNAAILILAYLGMRADPVSASTMPTAAEAVRALPTVAVLFAIWALLLYGILRHGEQKAADPLPEAERTRLPRAAKVLLIISALLLLLLEAVGLLAMLPEAIL